jgi:hypothetical protein
MSLEALLDRESHQDLKYEYARLGNDWVSDVLIEGSILALPEVDCDLPLSELNEGVSFPPDPAGAGEPLP